MTEDEIYGRTVSPEGKCGVYKKDGIMGQYYCKFDMDELVKHINSLSRDEAIIRVEELQDIAAEQMEWKHIPSVGLFPGILAAPIGEVRGNIENTRRFCSDVLAALHGY
jgi:hypothetical protein